MGDAVPQIYALMPKVLEEVGVVGKGERNNQQNYNFRSIDQLYNALAPAFAKYGITMSQRILEHACEERRSANGNAAFRVVLKQETTFWAPDGSNIVTETIGECIEYGGDKGYNKAQIAATKYAILRTLPIPTDEQKDADHDSPEVVSNVPQPKPPSKAKPAAKPKPAPKKASAPSTSSGATMAAKECAEAYRQAKTPSEFKALRVRYDALSDDERMFVVPVRKDVWAAINAEQPGQDILPVAGENAEHWDGDDIPEDFGRPA